MRLDGVDARPPAAELAAQAADPAASAMPASRRWLLHVAWLIAVTLWAGALWMWFDIRDATRSLPLHAAAQTPRVAESGKPEPVFVGERRRPRQAATSNAAPSDDTAAAHASRVGEPAVCGLDGAAGAVDADTYLAAERERANERAIASLQARGDDASRAAAWTIEIARRIADAVAAVDCSAAGSDCDARLRAGLDAASQASSGSSDRLLDLARSTGEAWIVQLALQACDQQIGAPKACAALSPRRLPALDADNAAAWLELAAREPAAADEAIFRASLAPRYDTRAHDLAARVDAALPPDTPPLQRWLAIERASAIGGRAAVAPAGVASRYCSETSARDPNRAQVCERIARRLAGVGHDGIDVLVGYAIGARLGWPDEARQAVRQQLRAGAEAQRLQLGAAPMSCAAIESQLALWRDARRVGETTAARHAIERSGRPLTELLALSGDGRSRGGEPSVPLPAPTTLR